LTVGVAQFVYEALGGKIGVDSFDVAFIPFLGLVLTYFVVNSGSVSLAVAFSSGVSVRESWARVIGSAIIYDLVASGLAFLLAFLYVEFEFRGVAVLLLPLFFVRHLYQMNQQLEQKSREQLLFMVKAIEARDPYTSGHSMRVAEYARTIARELGLSAKQVDHIETAALLHDVGKMYEEFVPLLRKEGRLTTEERMLMQSHPVRSAELVCTSAGLRGAVELAVRHHHENFDGSGYPDGLARDQIPIGARIIMIADTLDAMTTDRPYRRALSYDRVVHELHKYSHSQFDPAVVDLVVRSVAIRRLVEGTREATTDRRVESDPRTPRWASRAASSLSVG
jgi:putative nucleotidyltransferase with HDIG domain